ncbi:hypothetical protein VMCG_07803 [Cytospora schulzeri]|uniref:Glucose-methanol-choline oxidoreductase N-terminal domain-containing protein n=1 Tax=Cytospora schulzeri TaxID=448051 RepID=A0A423VZP4_9PEZI|nr:hypothetical protein VMCG_07803 [Valsa malicola]
MAALSRAVLGLLVVIFLATPMLATTVTNDTSVAANQTFDYVIVGAGLTGIVVGNKLSEKGYATLIIEAGPDPRWNPVVYNAEGRVQNDPYCNWLYPAYDENGSLLSQAIDSGACIGGSTSINGKVWLRPTATEVDKLEELGNSGWNWDALDPVSDLKPMSIFTDSFYMIAAERNHPPDGIQRAEGAGLNPGVHGFHGAINVSFPVSKSFGYDSLKTPMRIPRAVELYKEALPLAFPGLTIGNDLSNRTCNHTVSASSSWTIWYDPVTKQNLRSSAADGFLWAPDQQRHELTVLANHKVDKVLFQDNLTATGLVFGTRPGSSVPGSLAGIHTVRAKKEVILAAGSLASSSVLERSGIGNRSILQRAGIENVVDLPGVGCNLVDQPGTGAAALVAEVYQNDTSIINGINLFAPEISLVNSDQVWGTDGSYYYEQLTSEDSLRSRVQALVAAGASVNLDGAEKILNVTIDLIVNHRFPVAEFVGESYPTILEAVFWPLMPMSRGHVHINSSDPFQDPIIVPRFLTDMFDQQVAIAVSRRSQILFASAPFAQVVANPYYDPVLGPNSTDAEWLAWYKETSYGASHWVGSTAMLPRELGGVVNSELRVYGTNGLRVVDAGILPFEITSHPMSLLYAVAQRAAILILGDGAA